MNLLMKNSIVVALVIIALSSCNGKNASEKNDIAKEKSETITTIEDMNAFNEIISGNKPVLVDFYADWCAPCRMMAPILEQVAGDLKDEVKILKVNVDKNRNAAMKYGIRSIPTLILFQNGQVKWQGVGVIQADQIKQVIKTKI